MPIVGLGHTGLWVHDLEKMRDFYERVIGLTVTDEDDEQGIVFFSAQPGSSAWAVGDPQPSWRGVHFPVAGSQRRVLPATSSAVTSRSMNASLASPNGRPFARTRAVATGG
jgi:catechol 2,3-dioxygenase-like lactoylglutathione lyase family enzyme